MMDYILGTPELLLVLAGTIFILIGLLKIVTRKPKGVLSIVTGLIFLLIFYSITDIDALKEFYMEWQEVSEGP